MRHIILVELGWPNIITWILKRTLLRCFQRKYRTDGSVRTRPSIVGFEDEKRQPKKVGSQTLEPRKEQGIIRFSPTASWKNAPLLTPCFYSAIPCWTSDLQNSKINLYCLSHLVCGNLLQKQKTNAVYIL